MATWLVLIHQLPPEPSYLRVKVARRLQRIGAVQIKNTVYVLPANEQTTEDLQWAMREIRDGGGEANLFESRFLDGITDSDVEQRFRDERDADYDQILADAKALGKSMGRGSKPADPRFAPEVVRLRRRVDAVQAIDFFGAPRGPGAAAAIEAVERRMAGESAGTGKSACPTLDPAEYRGRTWVTRAGVHVDRMASAWLIRRFIDAEATFAFAQRGSRPAGVTFDMADGDFTHQGDRCTFEVLCERFGLADPALSALGEIVHDIDLKDEKFGREETAGVAALVGGIALEHRDDETRIARAASALDALYEWLRRKR